MRSSTRWLMAILLAASATVAAQHKIAIPAGRAAQVVILMRVDESGHHVERMSRAQLAGKPALPPAARGGAFRYTVTSADGVALASGEVADPRTIRAPLPLPGEKAGGHEVVRAPTGYYLIRVPESKAMRYLRIEPRGAAVPGASKLDSAAQVIDLGRIDIR